MALNRSTGNKTSKGMEQAQCPAADRLTVVDILVPESPWRRGVYGPVFIHGSQISGPGTRCVVSSPSPGVFDVAINGTAHRLHMTREGKLVYIPDPDHANFISAVGACHLEGDATHPSILPQSVTCDDDSVVRVEGTVDAPVFSPSAAVNFETDAVLGKGVDGRWTYVRAGVRFTGAFATPTFEVETSRPVASTSDPWWNLKCSELSGAERWRAHVAGSAHAPSIRIVWTATTVGARVAGVEAKRVYDQIWSTIPPLFHGWEIWVPAPTCSPAVCTRAVRIPLHAVPLEYMAVLGARPGMCAGGPPYIHPYLLKNFTDMERTELWVLGDMPVSGLSGREPSSTEPHGQALPSPSLVCAAAIVSPAEFAGKPSLSVDYICSVGTTKRGSGRVLFEAIVRHAEISRVPNVTLVPASDEVRRVYLRAYNVEASGPIRLVRDVERAPADDAVLAGVL